MMNKSEFKHNKAALKTQDSFVAFKSHKRKRNTEDMLLHKQEHITIKGESMNKRMDTKVIFTKSVESNIKHKIVLENYMTKVKKMRMIAVQKRTNNE